MTTPPDRRRFLKTATAGGSLLALGNLGALLAPGGTGAADIPVPPDRVRFGADVEPLVRLIEETERDKCLEVVVAQLRRGVSYRQFLAALFLAGIREVNPRPCGFKLHCVFVIQAAHAMSLDAPLGERLLPLAYALDYFKQCQADDAIRGDFVMRPVAGRLPAPERAPEELAAGMEAWDIDRAERAVVALVRRQGPRAAFEDLWRYGARDWRGIGHRAIYTANAWRTLQTVGWQHAEPVLRSLVVSLLCVGPRRRVDGYAFEDQCYLANAARVKEAAGALPGDWGRRAARRASRGASSTPCARARRPRRAARPCGTWPTGGRRPAPSGTPSTSPPWNWSCAAAARSAAASTRRRRRTRCTRLSSGPATRRRSCSCSCRPSGGWDNSGT
jgi:hypothetical protein